MIYEADSAPKSGTSGQTRYLIEAAINNRRTVFIMAPPNISNRTIYD